MKKIYMTPELVEIKIQTVGMLALSAGGETDNIDDLLAPEILSDFEFNSNDDFPFDEDDEYELE